MNPAAGGYPAPVELQTDLPATPEAAGRARGMVRDLLTKSGVTAVLDDALLVVSELATNAVRYGSSPISLHLALDDEHLLIAVQDGHPSDLPYPKVLTQTEPDGRGMHLVSAMASRWGWDRTVHSKVVWAEIRLK